MDEEFWANFIQNVLRIWVSPEVRRRIEAGAVAPGLVVYAVQVVMEPGVSPAEVRLNEEVNVVLGLSEGSPLDAGHVGMVRDFTDVAPYVSSFDLSEDDRPNAGHITLIRNGPAWFATFDLRYNSHRIAEHVVVAREFLNSAAEDLGKNRFRTFCANSFTAVELLAKARLMLHPDENLLSSRRHNYVISNFNIEARRGNVDQTFADLLNRLANLRNEARYPVGAFHLSSPEAADLATRAEVMYQDVLAHVPERSRRIMEFIAPREHST